MSQEKEKGGDSHTCITQFDSSEIDYIPPLELELGLGLAQVLVVRSLL